LEVGTRMKIGDHVKLYDITNHKHLAKVTNIGEDGRVYVFLLKGRYEMSRWPQEFELATDEDMMLWKLENLI
jgi:hypothetical protein